MAFTQKVDCAILRALDQRMKASNQMGLDMYLSAKHYLSEYDENDKRISHEIKSLFTELDGTIKEVTANVLYWRKANAIHAWFVNEVQDGKDECQESYVDRKKLEKLASLCESACQNKSKATDILPSCGGFFFGSTDIDEYYFDELERTAKELRKLLDKKYSSWEFYYRASW